MKKLVFGLLALMSAVAVAGSLPAFKAAGPDFSVVVYPTIPCDSAKVQDVIKTVFKQKDQEVTDEWKVENMFTARIEFEGKTLEGCAKEFNGTVVVIGEDGGGSVLPADEFVQVTNI